MNIIKEGDITHFVLNASDAESAIRQFICICHPEYSAGYVINPSHDDGETFIFTAKKAEPPNG